MTIQVGDRIPDVNLTLATPEGPIPVKSGDYFSGKRVALFAVPGAYTPTCSARPAGPAGHQGRNGQRLTLWMGPGPDWRGESNSCRPASQGNWLTIHIASRHAASSTTPGAERNIRASACPKSPAFP